MLADFLSSLMAELHPPGVLLVVVPSRNLEIAAVAKLSHLAVLLAALVVQYPQTEAVTGPIPPAVLLAAVFFRLQAIGAMPGEWVELQR